MYEKNLSKLYLKKIIFVEATGGKILFYFVFVLHSSKCMFGLDKLVSVLVQSREQ